MPHQFHGQIREQKEVLGLLDEAERGQGRALIVEGGEGPGKSALLTEAISQAERQGFAVATARALGDGEVIPLAPFLRSLGEAAPAQGPSTDRSPRADDRRAWLMEQLWLVEQLPLLFKTRSQQGPLLVTVEDVHRADPATLLALRVLPPRLAASQLVWLVTRRLGEGGPPVDQLFDMLEQDGATRLVLGPLSDETVADILTDVIGAPPGPDLVALAGEAGGNPALVVALAEGLSEEGGLTIENGRAQLASDRLPRRLHDLVARRLAALSLEATHLLEVAALVDPPISVEELSGVLGKPPSLLLPVLDEALGAGILQTTGPDLEFWCDLGRRAVAGTIPEPVRNAVRRQIGAPSPRQGEQAGDGRRRSGFAAYPLAAAPARSDGELMVLALVSWREGRVGEALDRTREAVHRAGPSPLGTGSPAVTDPRLALAAMLADLAHQDEADRVVGTVAADVEHTADPPAAAALATVRARLALQAGNLDVAAAEAAWVEDGALGTHPLLPAALGVLATAALRRGDLDRAAEHVERHRAASVDTPATVGSAGGTFVEAQLGRVEHGAERAMAVLGPVYDDLPGRRNLFVEEPSAAGWMVRTALAAGERGQAAMVAEAAALLAAGNPGFATLEAMAAHARGLVEEDPAALIRAGLDHRDPWARASASEDAGVVLAARGDRHGALAQFDQAMAAYQQAGAACDAGRVRSRLRSLGVRRRHWRQAVRPVCGWDSLTDTELNVADLVALGLTNRQVATRMFLSPHTIDFHLRQIFRKLDITSRVDLTRQVVERHNEEHPDAQRATV
jgi:DNA-binding CsgD family transcriptional regulator